VSGPTRVDPPGSLRGRWVTLEPIDDVNAVEVVALDQARARTPEMGGPQPARKWTGRFGPAMAVRVNDSGAVIGTVENDEMIGYPGVAVFIIYVDASRSRPGYAMEASGIYIESLWRNGAEILHLEVLSFNREMTRILDRRHRPPDVRMRRHAYVAGHYWDLLVYGLDATDWAAVMTRLKAFLPGGSRSLAALGSGRPG
jgi:hypothetical protein